MGTGGWKSLRARAEVGALGLPGFLMPGFRAEHEHGVRIRPPHHGGDLRRYPLLGTGLPRLSPQSLPGEGVVCPRPPAPIREPGSRSG